MSIYPIDAKPSELVFAFQVAALNLDIPSDLTSREDQAQWEWYVGNLGRGQQVRDFGRALDQFQALAAANPDIAQASALDQAKAYSKWVAAEILGTEVRKAFHRYTEETFKNPTMFKSHLEETTHHLVSFLESVNSADVDVWKKREGFLHALDKPSISAFIRRFDQPRGVAASAPKIK